MRENPFLIFFSPPRAGGGELGGGGKAPRTLSTGANSPCLPYRSTSIIPATTGEIEKGRSRTDRSAGFHRNSLRAMSSAAATPQTVLTGTAQRAIRKVILTACRKSGSSTFSRKGPRPLRKAW